MSRVITLLLCILFCNAPAFANELFGFDEPIAINDTYITQTQVELAILESIKQKRWRVKERSDNQIVAWLSYYKGYELILAINVSESEISFDQLSFKKIQCPGQRKKCEAYADNAKKWRLNLRLKILMNIHKHIVDTYLQDDALREAWIDRLNTASTDYKVQLARSFIQTEYFNQYALDEMASDVERNYQKKSLSSDKVQQYAYFCKTLARSKQDKYITLLKNVSHKAKSKRLRRYVEGYLDNLKVLGFVI